MKFLKFFLVLLFFGHVACSSDDSENVKCSLEEVSSFAMYYEYYPFQIFSSILNPDFDKIRLYYDSSGKLEQVSGGPVPVSTGANSIEWTHSYDITYNFQYDGNTVYIDQSHASIDDFSRSEYVIVDNKIISRIVEPVFDYTIPTGPREYHYVYNGDIVEEYHESFLWRAFHLENDNLVKIETFFYGIAEPHNLVGKNEIIFSEFDDTPNLLKNFYFMDGAFYKAFSKNNYFKIEHKSYTFNGDDFVLLNNHESFTFSVGYHDDGLSRLFVQNCEF